VRGSDGFDGMYDEGDSDGLGYYYPFLSTSQYISIWAPGAFTFAAGKQGGGQGKKFLQNVFGLDLAVNPSFTRCENLSSFTQTVYWFVR
jgi:hypothetical protein